MNKKALANKVRKEAQSSFTKSINRFKDDMSMVKMFASDLVDTYEVANLIEEGDVLKAAKKAWDMDTAARDEIHQDFWAEVEKARGDTRVVITQTRSVRGRPKAGKMLTR
jgi:hypothetical protein